MASRPAARTFLTHGIAATYKKGCRCEPCRVAAREMNRARRRRQAKIPFDPILAVMTPQQRSSHWALIESSKGKDICIHQADRLCIKFGYHPWLVYGDLWFKDLWEKDEQAKAKRHKG